MDLLGNYSSDDEDSDISERSRTPPTPIQKTAVHPGAIAPSVTNPQKPSPIKTQTVTKRGKKLMSLHSVLPPHILEQLTKSEATGSYEDSDDDDDNEDDEGHQKAPNKKPAANKKASASQDEGISNFLNALNSVQATTHSAAGNQLKAPPSTSNNNNDYNMGTGSKLGSAFVSAVTTTTVRKKGGTTSVTKSTRTSREDQPTTPTGGEQQQQPPAQSSPSHYKPLSLSPRTAFQPFRNANISAAPPVPMAATATSTSQVPAPLTFAPKAPPLPQGVPATAPYPPPASSASSYPYPHDDHQGPDNYYEEPEQQQTKSSNNKRSKKRQLQKALRAGQLDTQALDQQGVTQLEQARPSAYVPQEETYAVPAHGVKVVSTQMYNPSAGTTVQADMGKVKGKNQINHLMASAAQLELQQARQGGPKVNSQRAGAKRKYGW